MNNTVFYLNWTFWSFVVAFTALILSQLPKINVWFKGKKVDLEVHNRVTVTHSFGNPNINLYLGISNKGRAKIKFKKIELRISKERQTIANLICSSFFETSSSQSANLFFPFELSSDGSWDHSCWFMVDLDRNTEQKLRGLISALDTDISNKINAKTNKNELVEASSDLVEPLVECDEKAFIWEPGEYYIEIKLLTEPFIEVTKKFRFTLFETDTKELKDYSNDYKYGMNYYHQKNKGLNIPIFEDSIN